MTEVTFRAKWLLPMCGPAIENGWLRIADGQVAELGCGCPSACNTIDLGDVAILPALVNSHTHLEFSYLKAPIGKPGMLLCDWIVEVVEMRQQQLVSAADAIEQGLVALNSSGCGLVADIATTPVTYPEISPFRGKLVSFAEVLGLSAHRAQLKQSLAHEHVASNRFANRLAAGISPHAPYSTPFELVDWCVTVARDQQVPLAMHVAESDEERQLIERGAGPFIEQLSRIVPTASELFPWGASATTDLIKRLSGAPRALLVHGNYLRDDEIELLAAYPQLSVVYCPRTHHYFGHPKHPVDRLLRAGVRVTLGTDSLASNPDLSIWNEVQWLLTHRQDLHPHEVLTMATLAGADALGESLYGRLTLGSPALMLQLPLNGLSVDEAMAFSHPSWISTPVSSTDVG